ncbi:MAG: TlpA disulfide reductase family protein [Saprospiraceae bacterium]
MFTPRKVIGLIIISVFLLTSCQKNSKVFKPTTTIIDGQFTSIQGPVIIFQGKNEIKVPVDPSGKFRIDTKLEAAGVYKISFGFDALSVFLIPGDKISVTGDVRTLLSGTKFTGDHANENNFLLSFENLKQTSQPSDFQSFFSQSEEEFITAIEKRTNDLNQHQQEYQKQNGPFETIFAEIISQDLKYDEAIVKLNFPIYHKYYNPDQSLQLSDTYDSFLQNTEIDSDESMMVPNYKQFLGSYLEYKAETDSTLENTPAAEAKFNIIKSVFQSPNVKDWLLYDLMSQTLDMSVNNAASLIKPYNDLQKNEEYKLEINNRFRQWEPLLKGKTAPDFVCTSIEGKDISLKSLEGKLVYIDVWATWCGPCLRELPYLEKLQNEFKRDDLTFVSISIDENKAAWQNMVKEKGMKGLQLFSENAWSSPLVSSYMISGIPRFILIGKDGNIVDANAPRPSSPEIRQILSAGTGS